MPNPPPALTAMLFSPRISKKELAGLCRRVSTSLEAGVDLRTTWAREAERAGRRTTRTRLQRISEELNRGQSLPDALADTEDYFPEIFRLLVEVGDKTGHLGESLGQLAEHYEYQLKLRRTFLASIAWPMLQLTVAILVIGFLIWVLGVIGQSTGTTFDILGFGLVGTRGLMIYVAFLACVAVAIGIVVRGIQRGLVWTRPIQRAVFKIPVLGSVAETIALSRLAWTLHLTFNAGMDVRRALKTSLEAAGNSRYTDHVPEFENSVRAGTSLFETFSATGDYPPEFLDTLRVGEQTGRVVESMAHLSGQYRDRAAAAMGTLTMLAGFAVWAMVAVIIILMIFRIFSFYLGAIQEALPTP
ncbi:MAG: type II secretion system F family protein [Pirellulales bacterium]|nr:type II secretion system F family protein [Pirellulales bacterium]